MCCVCVVVETPRTHKGIHTMIGCLRLLWGYGAWDRGFFEQSHVCLWTTIPATGILPHTILML